MYFEDYWNNKGHGFIKNRSAYNLSKNPCTIKLKIWEIVVIIRILKAIGQIFSLILLRGVADKNKRCCSYCANLFPRVCSCKELVFLFFNQLNRGFPLGFQLYPEFTWYFFKQLIWVHAHSDLEHKKLLNWKDCNGSLIVIIFSSTPAMTWNIKSDVYPNLYLDSSNMLLTSRRSKARQYIPLFNPI